MATTTSHNKKSSAVKRILSEARELQADSSEEYEAKPLEDNIFEWHFTLRGPSGSEFADGIYHGRILLPAEYPFRPPSLMLLTPNGRWECNKKICLTFTGFHEEMWQPAWGIRTALLGVQAFMSARAQAAVGVGSLDYPIEERKRLAGVSKEWRCQVCGVTNLELLPEPDPTKERKTELLPEGLEVDTSAKPEPGAEPGPSRAQQQPQGGASGIAESVGQGSPGSGAEDDLPAVMTGASPDPENAGAISTPATGVDAHGQSEPSSSTALPLSSASPDEGNTLRNRAGPPGIAAGPSTSSGLPPNSATVASTALGGAAAASNIARPNARPAQASDVAPTPITTTTVRQQPQQQAALPPIPPIQAPAQAQAPIAPRPPTRSEARVAQLDRAILTVVLLLCGLVVRRLI